jgi:hypothetical protein
MQCALSSALFLSRSFEGSAESSIMRKSTLWYSTSSLSCGILLMMDGKVAEWMWKTYIRATFIASISKGLSYLSVNNKLSISVIPACMLINLPAAYSNIFV